MATNATRKQSEAPVQISPARKMLALSAKLASAPISSAQQTVLKFAQAVPTAPSLVVVDEQEMGKLLDSLDIDPMLTARKFMAMENNNQGLTPQQVYTCSPFFWPNSADGPSGLIAVVHTPDGGYRASGLASILVRAASGFTDHLIQVNGRVMDGVVLAKPIIKVPSIPRAIFDKQGSNALHVIGLLSGFEITTVTDDAGVESQVPSLPAVNIAVAEGRGRKQAAQAEYDPFADLDGWL